MPEHEGDGMPERDDPLLSSIAPGLDDPMVDWEVLLSASSPEDRVVLENLRQIRGIADFHRSLASGPADGARTYHRGSTRAPAPVALGADEAIGTWGHLTLRRRLGSGTYGEVFLAWDPRLHRDVALKLFHRDHGERFLGTRATVGDLLREGRMMARVRHPHVAMIHGADEHDGRPGIWMEYIDGQTLADLVRQQGPLSAQEATQVGRDLCGALAAVHAQGLIHQDVKAQNVMRERGGRIVLMDFGVGLEWGRGEAEFTGAASGTPLCMPPEAILAGRVTRGADIYSLGVLLFHLATGQYPVEAKDLAALTEAHRGGRRRLLRDLRPELPEAFVEAVEKALAPDPRNRYGTAGEMERALRGEPGSARVRPTRGRRVSRRAWLWALGGVATAAAAGGIWMAGLLNGETRRDLPPPVETPSVETAYPHGAQEPRPGEFSVQARFLVYPRDATQRRPLRAGDAVEIGDRVVLEYRSSVPSFLYVVTSDRRGREATLWPARGAEQSNPLPAGETHTLPGRFGSTFRGWEVTSRGGEERFVLVASTERLPEIEEDLAALPAPAIDRGPQHASLSPRAARRLRGIGGLAEVPEPPPGAGGSRTVDRLVEVAAMLPDTAETATGPWMRKFVLRNPE